MTQESPRRYRPRGIPPLTRHILAVNILALLILVAGLLYVGEYRKGLIASELASLSIQAEMFAGAIGEGAIATVNPSGDGPVGQEILVEKSRQLMRRLAEATHTRARLFSPDGTLIADSRLLLGPGGSVLIEELPSPDLVSEYLARNFLQSYDSLVKWLPGQEQLPKYIEKSPQRAEDYAEVGKALLGEKMDQVREKPDSGIILTASAPVQRYKQVLGALLLSKDSSEIDDAVFDVRINILKLFTLTFGLTILMSVYLAGTITRPIHKLATAAQQVRKSHDRSVQIPDFSNRQDEIGELAISMKEMTEALWMRMDAIESFAADVAHELKNPLTSLNSAVETAERITDPDQQRKLMSIIKDDVQRLDRLISDISNASRLDAELSRTEFLKLDLRHVLETLADLYAQTNPEHKSILKFETVGEMTVMGMEDRLMQVFRNLIANALSFSPPGAPVLIRAEGRDGWITITLDDRGPGIPEGAEEAIFERFYSERPEGETFGTHSGLGLSISRQIIEAHNGTLTAETLTAETLATESLTAEPPGDDGGGVLGSRFTVRLPETGSGQEESGRRAKRKRKNSPPDRVDPIRPGLIQD
jgi:two-component system sensor histidine kinase ChvG